MNNPIETILNLPAAKRGKLIRTTIAVAIAAGVLWSVADDARQKKELRRSAVEEYRQLRQSVLELQRQSAEANFGAKMPPHAFRRFLTPPSLQLPMTSRAASSDVQRAARRQHELEILRKQVEEDERRLDKCISEGGAGVLYQGNISRAKSRIFDLENED